MSIILQLSIIYSYLKQLENENNQLTVPDENQKEIVLLLSVSNSILSNTLSISK